METVLFSSFAAERSPDLQICTQIVERNRIKIVRKSALNNRGYGHIQRLKEHEAILKNTFLKSSFFSVCPIISQGESWVEFTYIEGKTLEQWAESQILKGNIEGIKKVLSVYWDNLLVMDCGPFTPSGEFTQIFGTDIPHKEMHGANSQDIDLILTNLFFNGEEPKNCIVTDYEWVFSFMVPLEYVFYRMVFCSVALSRLPEKVKNELYGLAGIEPKDLDSFLHMEIAFQKHITGQTLTMADHYRRMGQGVIPLCSERSPYEIIIRNNNDILERKSFYKSTVRLDLAGFSAEILRVQLGYPFNVVRLETKDMEGWICENADYSEGQVFLAGNQPLIFRWKGSGGPALNCKIFDIDELIYQKMIKARFLNYGNIIGKLETQIRSQGDQIQGYVNKIGELETQVRSQGDQIQEYVSQIGDLETQVRSQGDQIQEYVKQIGDLEMQVCSQADQIQGYMKQIGNLETQVYDQEDYINAYQAEWNVLVSEGKVYHDMPVAIIRQKQEQRMNMQNQQGIGPDATIVIPTKNGGELFGQVLDRIYGQVTQYTYEVICVDSGSTDNTLQIIQEHPAKLIQIPAEEYGHGKTRNLGASYGNGEFICFLTQDALPVHESWLENMLNAMKLDPQIAGGFGRHLPYSQCNFIDERDINGLFAGFGQTNTIFYNEDPNRYETDPGYRSVLAFFSDNNSCLRRSIWEQYPYPDVEFAEDQIWMRQMIEKGYKKVYCPDATVYHSHNYDPATYFMRYYDEHKGLYEIHGYTNLKHWYYIPAAVVKHVKSDIGYIRTTTNSRRRKLGMVWYSIRRNYARYTAGFIGGHYHEKSPKKKMKLDRKYSQQYRQRRGIYGKNK